MESKEEWSWFFCSAKVFW